MRIDIVERRPVRVACLRYTGPRGEPLGRFWRGTVAPWLADNGLVDCPRYGVIVDDTRYDACIELPAGLPLPDAAETIIRGGHYAITCFKGDHAQVSAAWGAFGETVVANPVNRLDESRPAFEHMPRGAWCDHRTGVFCCELCLPVAG